MNFKKLTPNLIVENVEASLNFFRQILGFQLGFTVPEAPPYVFGSVTSGGVEIFLNQRQAVAHEYPALGAKPIGGSLTLYIEVEGLQEIMAAVRKSEAEKTGAKIVMPVQDQFYGMREFAFEAPEGWIVTIAERIKN